MSLREGKAHLAVVGENAVGLGLHVSDLGVDGAAGRVGRDKLRPLINHLNEAVLNRQRTALTNNCRATKS